MKWIEEANGDYHHLFLSPDFKLPTGETYKIVVRILDIASYSKEWYEDVKKKYLAEICLTSPELVLKNKLVPKFVSSCGMTEEQFVTANHDSQCSVLVDNCFCGPIPSSQVLSNNKGQLIREAKKQAGFVAENVESYLREPTNAIGSTVLDCLNGNFTITRNL